jgi:hypothetical protein
VIVGQDDDAGDGFLLNGGTFTSIINPGQAIGINDDGMVTGYTEDPTTYDGEGFILSPNIGP